MSDADTDARILASWQANADAWAATVARDAIASRREGTDAAIVQAILQARPRRVLDAGCGEGWLARRLLAAGIAVVGIDPVPALVQAARQVGAGQGGEYHVLDTEALAAAAPGLGRFDLAVCNFSLFAEQLGPTLAGLAAVLEAQGLLLIQTPHPDNIAGAPGWQLEDFGAFPLAFPCAMPWYCRDLAGWRSVLQGTGFRVEQLNGVFGGGDGRLLSLLIRARRSGHGAAGGGVA